MGKPPSTRSSPYDFGAYEDRAVLLALLEGAYERGELDRVAALRQRLMDLGVHVESMGGAPASGGSTGATR